MKAINLTYWDEYRLKEFVKFLRAEGWVVKYSIAAYIVFNAYKPATQYNCGIKITVWNNRFNQYKISNYASKLVKQFESELNECPPD